MRLVVPRERVDDVSAVVLELEAVGVQEDYLPGEAPEPRQPWDTGPVSPEPARVLLKAWWPESVADGARVAVARAVVAWRGIEAPEWTLVDDQDWAEAWNKRATLYFLQDRDEESVADIEATLKLEPRHFGALGGFGQICLRQDEPVSARIAFEKALLVNPHLDGVREIVHELGAEYRPVVN